MVRKLVSALVVAALIVGVSISASNAGEDKVPTTKEIMSKMNGKKDAPGLLKKSEDAGKAEKWEDAAKLNKEMLAFSKAILKNKPTKGDQESWEKKTKLFAEHWAAINDAGEKKDAAAYAEAIKKFKASCMECHMEHRPAKKK